MDVLNRQARICLIESDGSAVRRRRKVNELLEVLSARRGGRVLGKLKYKIEYLSDILREIGNVGVERAVVDSKKTDLVVLERHELCEVGCADAVQVFGCPVPPGSQEQLYLGERKR